MQKEEQPGDTRVELETIHPSFSPEQASVIMALIRSGWQTAVLGSRHHFELLARVEDIMIDAGATPDVAPLVRQAGP